MDDAAIGSVFAGHRLEEVAGKGGMGVVYRATDLALDRHVAVKLIAPTLAGDPAFRRRFVSESKVAASLDHPNVIPIHHAGEQDGVLFQVMRYVEGEDLRALLRREGRLVAERAAPIVAAVAAALDAAHARGLVHRDVKPANVLLDAERHVYLTDFGLAVRLGGIDDSRPGRLLGTVHYISPEQIRGEEIGARTDVYALGAMLFHMLTGGVPFPADTDEARLWAHLSEPPPAPSRAGGGIPAAYDGVIAHAMAKDPAHRYASAGDLSRAASAAVGEPPAPPPAPPVDDRRVLAKRALADPFSLAAAGAIVLAGVILGGLALALPLALVVYLAGAVRAFLDDDIRESVRPQVEPARAPPPASGQAEEIQLLLRQAAQTRARVHDAIDESDLPYTEVAAEVDRLVATMQDAAARAQRLHEGLRDAPPDEVAARLERVKAEGDPAKADLITALTDQLAVQRRMEAQLGHFYAEMDRMLIEVDTVRGNLVNVSASSGRDHQAEVAGEVRELRDDMGAVAAGIDPELGDGGEGAAVTRAAELKAQLELERRGEPFLLYRDGEGEQRLLVLDPAASPVTIGRREGAAVALAWDSEVSRLHSTIERLGADWVLIDDGLSRNGSFVNGARMLGRHRLEDGDRLCFGETVVLYRDPGDGQSFSTASLPASALTMPLTPTQRKVLIALCRPVNASAFATPATNREIAEEIFLSVDAVKAQLRVLFDRFGLGDLPQNQKRARLAASTLVGGLLSPRDF